MQGQSFNIYSNRCKFCIHNIVIVRVVRVWQKLGILWNIISRYQHTFFIIKLPICENKIFCAFIQLITFMSLGLHQCSFLHNRYSIFSVRIPIKLLLIDSFDINLKSLYICIKIPTTNYCHIWKCSYYLVHVHLNFFHLLWIFLFFWR